MDCAIAKRKKKQKKKEPPHEESGEVDGLRGDRGRAAGRDWYFFTFSSVCATLVNNSIHSRVVIGCR